ncbi:MAG: hypothetical protein ACREJT_15425, partial [Myxococcota bacterium]
MNSDQPEDDGDEQVDGESDPLDMLGDGQLGTKQQAAIIALLNEPTIEKAAARAKVGQRTLVRWMGEPVFRKVFLKARRDAFSQAIGLTQRFAPVAVNTLVKVMADDTAPHHARVSAASTLLKFGREGIELDDLAMRVEALEQASQDQERGQWSSRGG